MNKYILMSGGAKGADQMFEKYAKIHNHVLQIYKSFDLNNYDNYDNYLIHLNKYYLHRTYPTRNEYCNNLLRRDILIGLRAEQLFAITWFEQINDKLIIHGGTAWACYAFIDKYNNLEINNLIDNRIPCYIYDQKVRKWFQVILDNLKPFNYKFVIFDGIPKITYGKYAGIGTREINEYGIQAIKQLYE